MPMHPFYESKNLHLSILILETTNILDASFIAFTTISTLEKYNLIGLAFFAKLINLIIMGM